MVRPPSSRPSVRPTALRACVVAFAALLGVVGAGVWARAARAEEPSPLARLKPEERAVLERKIPGLTQLPLERQEQIVRNVERLRSLDPQALERIQQRLRAADQAGLRGERLDERVRDWAEVREQGKQGQALLRGQGIRAVGLLAWRQLPAEMRADPAVSRLGERAFAAAFHQLFWGEAWRTLPKDEALAFEPPPGVPEPERARWTELRERARGDDRLLGRLQEEVLRRRALEAARAVLGAPAAPGPSGPEPVPALTQEQVQTLGQRLRDLAPKAYDEALRQVVASWREKGGERWSRAVLERLGPTEVPPEARKPVEALRFALTLEEFAARHPTLGAAADTLLRAALVDDLGMPAQEFERLPPRGDAAAAARRREAFLLWAQRGGLSPEVLRWALLKAWSPGERWAGGGAGQRGQRLFPGGPRRPGNGAGRPPGDGAPPKDGEPPKDGDPR